MNILLAVAVLALVMCVSILAYIARVILSYRIHSAPTVIHPIDAGDVRALLLEETRARQAEIEILRIAISEGIARVDRHEKRVQKTVTSARRLVRDSGVEHAGIEAEYAELEPANAEPIQPLPAMPEEVETTRVVRIPGGQLEIGVA